MGTTGVNYRIRSRVIKTTILLILSWCFLYFLVILSYTSNKVLFMYLLSSLAYLIIHTIPLTFVPVYSITVVFHKNIIRTNATLVCKSMNHLEESVERKQLILQDIDFFSHPMSSWTFPGVNSDMLWKSLLLWKGSVVCAENSMVMITEPFSIFFRAITVWSYFLTSLICG